MLEPGAFLYKDPSVTMQVEFQAWAADYSAART